VVKDKKEEVKDNKEEINKKVKDNKEEVKDNKEIKKDNKEANKDNKVEVKVRKVNKVNLILQNRQYQIRFAKWCFQLIGKWIKMLIIQLGLADTFSK